MSQSRRILIGLGLGLATGIGLAEVQPRAANIAATWVEPIGTLWLNALKMTIIPLIVSLLITGICQAAAAARAGQVTRRALAAFAIIIPASAIMAAIVTPALLTLWPIPGDAARVLRAALTPTQSPAEIPTISSFLASIIPSNVVAAAANNATLPLIVFTTIFAFAITKLPRDSSAILASFFGALQDAMLIVIHWVLLLAPIGVLALAFAVAAHVGVSSLGALVHYCLIVMTVGLIVWAAAFLVARIWGKISLSAFIEASLPAQAVALSTQSSLASLPAMLEGARKLRLDPDVAGVVLPLAVALFRATGPAMNLAVAIYVAHWFGIPLGAPQLLAGVLAATLTTLGAVSLPGQITFVTSIAPICLAMGVPIEPLALLIAVETIPDIVRTIGNVTMDMAVSAGVDHRWHDKSVEEATNAIEP